MQDWEKGGGPVEATRERATRVRTSGTAYGKLRPGPGQPASTVAAHQLSRIRAAMIQMVATRGYRVVKVRDLVQLAGVSSRAFYEHFTSKEDCLLRTYEHVTRRASQRIVSAQANETEWRQRLRRVFAAFAREVESDPVAARFVLVAAHQAGPAALEQARRAEATFEAMLSETLARPPGGVVVPPLVVEAMTAGAMHVSRNRLLAGRERELPALENDLVEWALSYVGEPSSHLVELDLQTVWRNTVLEPVGPSGRGENEGWPASGDRGLILAAVTKLAVASGYDDLTANKICSAARVTRRTFAGYFDGVEDCFRAALQQKADEALVHAARARIAGRTWPGGVYRAIAALCEQIAEDPFLARACFTNDFPSESPGARYRQHLITVAIQQLNESVPAELRSDPLTAEASNGAVWALFYHHIIRDWVQRRHIAATLSFVALAPVIGASAAVAAIHREHAE